MCWYTSYQYPAPCLASLPSHTKGNLFNIFFMIVQNDTRSVWKEEWLRYCHVLKVVFLVMEEMHLFRLIEDSGNLSWWRKGKPASQEQDHSCPPDPYGPFPPSGKLQHLNKIGQNKVILLFYFIVSVMGRKMVQHIPRLESKKE